jgi:hypothetical protein
VEPGNRSRTELLQSHDKNWMDEELSKESGFLRWKPFLMTTLSTLLNDRWFRILDQLLDKGVSSFERTDSNFKSSTVGKKLSQIPQPSAVTCSHLDQSMTLHQQKDYDLPKAQMIARVF